MSATRYLAASLLAIAALYAAWFLRGEHVVAALIVLCAVMTFAAGPAMSFFNATAQSLHDAPAYARSVLPAEGAEKAGRAR